MYTHSLRSEGSSRDNLAGRAAWSAESFFLLRYLAVTSISRLILCQFILVTLAAVTATLVSSDVPKVISEVAVAPRPYEIWKNLQVAQAIGLRSFGDRVTRRES